MESMSLLNMLAEVASEKLQTDPTVKMITMSEESKKNMDNDSNNPTDSEYHNLGKPMSLLQVSNTSDNNILRLFTISQSNEMKRKFYFTCRLIPQYCEETFQSFGSEEKARNLMKKHLKEHLFNLLNEFKDTESRETYILRTVSSSKSYGNSELRVGGRRAKKARVNLKTKMIVEKENTSKLLKKSISQRYIEDGDSYPISEEPNMNLQAETSSCMPDTCNSFSSHQNATPIVMNQLPQYSSIEVIPNINNVNYESHSNSNSAVNNNGIKENSSVMNISETNYQYATTVLQAPTYVLNLQNTYNNELGVCSNQMPITKGNNIVEFIPTTQYIYTGGGSYNSSEIYNVPVNNSNIVHENTDSQNQVAEGGRTEKYMETEIIDIKIEEPVKLEVLNAMEEPLSECLSTVSHDHGYISNDTNVVQIDQEPSCCKDEKVDEELMALWDDITGGSGLIEFNNPAATQSAVAKDTDAKVSMQGVSDLNKVENSMNFSEIKKKKVRLKGRGKFIGQSKSEREKALNFIEKIKSQPNLQLENLECNICNPPRVFTAAATLLSHYKSHAGIRPYVCVFCESVFTRQHSLNYHYLIHLNKTRFTCVDCGRKFRHPSHFKEHRRRHTGESPFECTDCFMRFKTRNTYKRHLRTRHGKKLTTRGSVHSINEENKDHSDNENGTNEEQTFTLSKNLGSQMNGNASVTFNNIAVDKPAYHPKRGSENNCSSTHEKESVVTTFGSTVDKNYLTYEHNDVIITSSLVCNNQDVHVKYSIATIDSNISVTQSSISKVCNKVPEGLISANLSEKSAKIFAETPLHNLTANQDKRQFTYILKKTNSKNVVDSDSKHFVSNTTNTYNANIIESGETSKSIKKLEIEPVLNNYDSPYFICDNSDSVVVSHSKNYENMKSDVSGSILGALLTSGTSGVHKRYSISGQAKNTSSECIVKEQKKTNVNDCVKKNTDKWDSLMREVVSLSTMVKEKTEPKVEYATYNHNPYNSLEVGKEFGSNIISYDRPDGKDVLSEVYVLKYANGSSGTRVAKVFKANPSSNPKQISERPKENENLVLETPILIRSSVGSWKERRDK